MVEQGKTCYYGKDGHKQQELFFEDFVKFSWKITMNERHLKVVNATRCNSFVTTFIPTIYLYDAIFSFVHNMEIND